MNGSRGVGILGATGYAGTELVRLLASHPGARIEALASRQFAGRPAADAFPGFPGMKLQVEGEDVEPGAWRARGIDSVFSALPHGSFAGRARSFLDAGIRIIDLSADFRPGAVRAYEDRHGSRHPDMHLVEKAIYGLTEWCGEELVGTQFVANPGCYATAVLLAVLPAVESGWWNGEPIVANALSGVTGSGRAPSTTTHFVECGNGAAPYKVGEAHSHLAEMRDSIRCRAPKHERPNGLPRLVFNPHLVPMARGIVANVAIPLSTPISLDDAAERYRERYRESAFVRIADGEALPETRHVRGSNRCDLAVRVADAGRLLLVYAAIDNLVKGAAGQAVQNWNRMMGWPEGTGLPRNAWVNA
jgi:N-acetyl-gamma-glutamyl-phosphate reductase